MCVDLGSHSSYSRQLHFVQISKSTTIIASNGKGWSQGRGIIIVVLSCNNGYQVYREQQSFLLCHQRKNLGDIKNRIQHKHMWCNTRKSIIQPSQKLHNLILLLSLFHNFQDLIIIIGFACTDRFWMKIFYLIPKNSQFSKVFRNIKVTLMKGENFKLKALYSERVPRKNLFFISLQIS